MMNVTSYQGMAEAVARKVVEVIRQRGLEPAINNFWLAETPAGSIWLVTEFDPTRGGKSELYTHKETLKQIRAAVRGRKVVKHEESGVFVSVLLSNPPSLPDNVPFDGWEDGKMKFGIGLGSRKVEAKWSEVGHMIIAGMTGYGKSELIRLVVSQAIPNGYELWLLDPDGRTFSRMRGHPSLADAVAETHEQCEERIDQVVTEINRRAMLYNLVDGHPDNLTAYNILAEDSGIETIKPQLCIIDEFNGLVMATGGPRAQFARAATQVAWRARKFGIQLVLAGQTFEKAIVGPVRDQMVTKVCFRVGNAAISRIVLGHAGAESLAVPGRAVSNRWGVFQAYITDGDDFEPKGNGLGERDVRLLTALIEEHDGDVTYEALGDLGLTRKESTRVRADWQLRGLTKTGMKNKMIVDLGHPAIANMQTVQSVQTQPGDAN